MLLNFIIFASESFAVTGHHIMRHFLFHPFLTTALRRAAQTILPCIALLLSAQAGADTIATVFSPDSSIVVNVSLGDKGEAKEGEEEYQDFLDKFEAKHTTDDCYTPAKVYDAVAAYVERTYQVSRESFVRPFYPGGDYQNEKYIPGAVVVDNPPFSILAEIIRFYSEKKIPFFLFAPALTLFSSAAMSSCSCICINVAITYENGATIATSFVTNMDPEDVRARSCPELFKAVDDANKANLAETRKELPTYSYPYEVITAPMIGRYSKYGVEFMVPRSRSEPIDSLEAQTKAGKAIFGKGLLISEKTAQAHERAEAEANERAAEARATQWELSERERAVPGA